MKTFFLLRRPVNWLKPDGPTYLTVVETCREDGGVWAHMLGSEHEHLIKFSEIVCELDLEEIEERFYARNG